MSVETGYIDGKQTPTYRIWAGMKNRCLNVKNRAYRYYGGRGITVCERWMTYSNFLADMGERPSPSLSLDRYPDNDGPYAPGNCRWATRQEQRRNMPDVRFVGAPLAELGVKAQAVRARVRRGWSFDDAVSITKSHRSARGRRIT